tara:strand:+ start:10740 stop:10937 length:198 start_codon:yes stop_codon:yes gene_type:complete
MYAILEYDEYGVLISIAEGPGDGWTRIEALSEMYTMAMETVIYGEMHSYKVVQSGHAPMMGSMVG